MGWLPQETAGTGSRSGDQESCTFPSGSGAAGRHKTAKLDFTQSAKPYKEKAFEAWNWMQSSREGGRTARLCPSRDERFREKARKPVPCVP